MLPELLELSGRKKGPVLLLVFGPERQGKHVVAPAYLAFKSIRKGRHLVGDDGVKLRLSQPVKQVMRVVFEPIELEEVHV